MESGNSYSDPHASAAIQIVIYDMENKSTPDRTVRVGDLAKLALDFKDL